MIVAPLLGLMLNRRTAGDGRGALTLLAGTPALTFIGLIGAALSVALRRGGLLLAVLVLPLTIPVLIFGVVGRQCRHRRPAAVRPAFHHSLRAVLDEPGARAVRRRGGIAPWTGITPRRVAPIAARAG